MLVGAIFFSSINKDFIHYSKRAFSGVKEVVIQCRGNRIQLLCQEAFSHSLDNRNNTSVAPETAE